MSVSSQDNVQDSNLLGPLQGLSCTCKLPLRKRVQEGPRVCGDLLNKWTSQGFAPRVGIRREPRLYWLFLESGVGLYLKSPLRRCSDLVGSTALSAPIDPEDLREVISSYQKAVAETVQRLGGFVAKYMGDGVLVYFGYPQAHEDDAERAVRAGLDLIATVGALNIASPLQTRVGIATGLVVVGDLIGSGEAQERGIVGETPNLAARLQAIAEPNAVVIAEGTRNLLGNLFDLRDLGALDLKGIAEPVRAWAALRAASIESRFEALHSGGWSELVGREEELELLLRRWSRAKKEEGQVVLLSGEAGIGKSRLTAALLESIVTEPHTRLRYFCSPQHTDSAFYPIIGQMERAAGFAYDDALGAKLGKLDGVLAQTSTSKQEAALFAEWVKENSPRGRRNAPTGFSRPAQ
jgi:class 3 adenylate cyclase